MSLLPRVSEKARELVAREFDDRGPDACMREIIEHLKRNNPELLDMAAKCAGDLRNPAKAMLGFGMFYRLLTLAPAPTDVVIPLPRVSAETRELLVAEIDEKGPRILQGKRRSSSRRTIRNYSRWRTTLL
jgi:hypothetical protein